MAVIGGNGSIWVKAPSNIALIKYMGKDDSSINVPANGSLSLTLSSLCTFAEVAASPAKTTEFALIPEVPRIEHPSFLRERLLSPKLSEAGVARVIRHMERVKSALPELLSRHGLRPSEPRRLELRTVNTFPAASGIASSASSFAAITLGTALALSEDPGAFRCAYESTPAFRQDLARVSRQGSGSSCRSLEGPWVLWERESAAAIRAKLPPLTDFVLLIGDQPKDVSSSEAHLRVKTSPLWEGRTERVAERLRSLEAALGDGDLAEVSRIAWAEMWEMHSLFHTSADPFTYWEPGSVAALRWLIPWMSPSNARDVASPIVTMDAGANVHLLVPTSEAPAWRHRIETAFPSLRILEDREGSGAEILRS